MKVFLALLMLLLPALPAAAVTTTTSYTVTVTITPAITAVGLSNTTVSTTGPANAGTVVGALSVVTNPVGGTYTGVITLGGTNASSFVLTNGGVLPCNLVVGAANLAAGPYSITLSATQ
jgi:hypothetical protein